MDRVYFLSNRQLLLETTQLTVSAVAYWGKKGKLGKQPYTGKFYYNSKYQNILYSMYILCLLVYLYGEVGMHVSVHDILNTDSLTSALTHTCQYQPQNTHTKPHAYTDIEKIYAREFIGVIVQ